MRTSGRGSSPVLTLVLLLVVLHLLVTLVPRAFAATTTLTLSASSGAPGVSVHASGSGFWPGERVKLRWETISGPELARTTADSAGGFSNAAFAVPAVNAGEYFVWAIGDDSIAYATAPFTVTGSTTGPSPTATPTPTPTPTTTATPTPTPTTTATPPPTPTPTLTPTATATPPTIASPSATATATATPTPSVTPTSTRGVTLLPAGPLPAAGAPVAVAVHPGLKRLYVAHRALYRDVKVNTGLLPTDRVSVVDQTTGTVLATVPVGNALNGAGQGIAVDPVRNRVFVTNSDDNTVSIIDAGTNTVVATVQVGAGPAGVAVDPVRGLAYVANSFGKSVTVLDAATGRVAGTVEVGGGAYAVAVDPVSQLAYVTVEAAPWTIVALDGQTLAVRAQVPLNLLLSLSGLAVDPGARVYVADQDTGQIAVIDISGSAPREAGRFTGGVFPQAVAVDPVTRQIHVADGGTNEVAVFDRDGTKLKTLPTLRRPTALALDAAARRLYVTDTLSDSLTTINLDRLAVTGHVPLGAAPFGVAYDPADKRLYAANYPADAISVIDPASGALLASWPAGAGPAAVAVDAGVQQLYSLNFDDQSLSVLSTVDGAVKTTVKVGVNPVVVAVDASTHRVYATGGNGLTVLDGTTNQVIATVDVGSRPAGIAIDEAGGKVYVASLGTGAISVLDAATLRITATWKPQLASVWGLAVDPGLKRLFVTVVPNVIGDFSGVQALDTATGNVLGRMPTGNRAALVVVDPRTRQVFATDSHDGTLTVLDGATGAVTAVIPTGRQPNGLALDAASGRVYVANFLDGTIAVVDPATAGAAVPTEPVRTPTPAPGEDSGSSVRQEVGREGGEIEARGGAERGGVTVSFPPNALSSGVNVTVAVTDAAPAGVTAPSGSVLLNKAIEVTPDRPVVLGRSVRIRVALSAADLGGRSISAIRIGVVLDTRIDPKPTRVLDASAGIVEAEVDHFTKFAVTSVTGQTPTLTGPADGATLNGLSAVLTWTNPPGTTQYQLQVIPFNGDGPGADLIRNAETSYTITAPDFGSAQPNYMMLPGITYIWRVRTSSKASFAPPDDPSWSAWSVRTFRTASVSSATITLTAPAEGGTVASLTPTLSWVNSDRSVFYYEVQLSKDPAFNADPATATAAVYWELRHGAVTSPPNSYTVPSSFPLEPGTRYFWRVRPRVQGDGVPVAWTGSGTFWTP